MHAERIGTYDIECSGVQLVTGQGWAAYLAIYGPSSNPMHRNIIFPEQRVLVEAVFASEEEAEREAHRAALEMIG